MGALLTLYRQHWRTEWRSVLIWGVLLGLMQLYAIGMWDSLRTTGSLADMAALVESLPPVLQAMYGGIADLTTLAGWVQLYGFGGWLHLPLLIFTALYVSGLIAQEVDRRTIEFVLAQPVARWQLVLTRWLSLVTALVILHALMLAGVIGGVHLTGHTPETGLYLLAQLNSVVLYVAIGSSLLALSVLINEYSQALALTLGLAVGMYILYSAGSEAGGFLHDLRPWLPFALFRPADILGAGQFPTLHLLMLSGIAVAALALSVWLFQRKQIAI